MPPEAPKERHHVSLCGSATHSGCPWILITVRGPACLERLLFAENLMCDTGDCGPQGAHASLSGERGLQANWGIYYVLLKAKATQEISLLTANAPEPICSLTTSNQERAVKKKGAWEYGSVTECLSSIPEALGSIPSITIKKERKRETQEEGMQKGCNTSLLFSFYHLWKRQLEKWLLNHTKTFLLYWF